MKITTTGLKLQLIVLFTIIAATMIITLQSIYGIKHLSEENIQKYTQEAYLNEERELKNYISIAIQTINLYYNSIQSQKNSTNKASKAYELQTKKVQQKVLNILSDMRFGESGYFWINDTTPTMIMHPTHPDLDGKNLLEYKDSNGVKLFKEMVQVVKEKGEGTLTYYWPRDGYASPQQKRSYVKLFEPWGWVIGTGEYIDHIEKRIAKMKIKEQQEINKLIIRSITISTIISIILILSVSFIIKKAIITPLNKREIEANIIKQNAQELRALTDNIPGFAYKYRRFADEKEEFLYASSGVFDMYGVTSQMAVSNIAAVRAVMYPEDMPGYRAAVDESANTLSTFHYEFRVMHPIKGELWLESISSPHVNKDDGSIIWYGITLDITEQKKQEAKLIKKEQEYRTLAENIPDPIFRYDTNAKRIYVNPAVEKISGISSDKLLGQEPTQTMLVSSKESELIKNSILKVIKTAKPDTVEVIFNAPDGKKIYYQDNHIPEFGPDGKVESVLTIVRDVTAERMLATREEMFRTLAENSPDIIMRYDEEANRIYANPAFAEQTGIPKELILNHKPETQWGVYFKMLNMTGSEYQNKIKQIIKTGESEMLSTESIILATGEYIAHEVQIVAERDTNAKIIGALAIGRNITERKNIEKRIEFMSQHDALTGFANRILAKERTEQIIAQAKRKGNNVAILFLDLDEFKSVNDSLGHSAGDTLLKMVAMRLQECIRASDTISRQGGDEFLIILPDINEMSEIERIANKLLQEFKQSFNVSNNMIATSASIGIALYPDDGENFEQLLQSADAAMYKAKESGKNNYRFYTQQMKNDLVGSFQIQNDLKDAIKNKEFVLYYQPQIDLKYNKIIGVEALIRWQHPTQGMIPPLNFISIAESSGLIVEIGEWVLLEACRQAALWNKEGKDIIVAVNISAVQFKRGNLKEVIKNALHVTGLDPQYLELELTESILINDTENVLEAVQVIKELGIKLSIDDFGTGYSSLSYLKRFAVDKLKIDQSFVRDLINDKDDASIVKTIIQMAKSFNLRSIAEGVENKEVLAIIEKFGCDEVQGYHFAKPMAIGEFEKYYHNYIA